MPVNLELKIKLSSFDEVKNILNKNQIEFIGTLNQKDIYYKKVNSGSLLKLRIENGKKSLIYYSRDEKKQNRWSDYYVTAIDGKDAEKVFEVIFGVKTVVEKQRSLYYFMDTRIHLDEVKNLGFFLELETLIIKDKKDAKLRFEKVIDTLNLDTGKQIRKSYSDLIKQNSK